MSETSVIPCADDRRGLPTGDRRLLHRGDDGRRTYDGAPTDNTLPPLDPEAARVGNPVSYLSLLGVLFVVLWGAVLAANYSLNPFIYSRSAKATVAEEWLAGNNYGVFDLNIDTRGLRREHIARLTETPEVIVVGASHWQEARDTFFPGRNFYNAHIHRDYYEDILALSELLIANDRLPETMIISIRDLTFSDYSTRTDYLWLPFLPEYRAMARRLGIKPHSWFDTFFIRPYLDLTSLPAAFEKAKERLFAPEIPGPTKQDAMETLDVLNAKGFIHWSAKHKEMFTAERSEREALQHADHMLAKKITIDPEAVEAVDRLLALLKERGVNVMLVHPPFNPIFYARIENTAFSDDLESVVDVTAQLAAKYGIPVFGSFDPAKVGCTSSMYIDAEHSGPECLSKVIAQAPGL